MIGKFENGQRYSFFTELTAQIMDVVGFWRQQRPQSMFYNGMDFSHVFESFLYFGTVLDEALNALEAGAPYPSCPPLSNDLAVMLARHWFGRQNARRFEASRSTPARTARAAKRAIHWQTGSSPVPLIQEANLPERCDVLFYGRSPRMIRYMAPVAYRLSGRYAYLIPSGQHQLQKSLADQSKPFFAAAGVKALRPFHSQIGRYAPHLGFFADDVERALRRVRPRLVLLAEGNSPDDEVINLVGIKLGIPVICLQQGWSPILHPGFRNMHYSAMLVWGPGFADLLSASNPHQAFVSTGNYVLQPTFRLPRERPVGVLFFHQDMDRGLGGRRGSELMLMLAERLAAANPDMPVYYRPHPLGPLDNTFLKRLASHPNIVIQEPSYPLAKALDLARITVSIYSTTILESAASGCIPLIFNVTSMPHFWPDMAESGAAVEVHSLEDAFEALQRLLSDDGAVASYIPALQQFTARFFCATGDEALRNTLDALHSLMC